MNFFIFIGLWFWLMFPFITFPFILTGLEIKEQLIYSIFWLYSFICLLITMWWVKKNDKN